MNRGWAMSISVAILSFAGCGKVPEPTFSSELVPAEGVVRFGTEPAAGVEIVFTPEASNVGASERHPASATTDGTGRFSMTTPPGGTVKDLAAYTGVMPGDYAVTFHKFVMPDGSPFTEEMAKTAGPMASGARDLVPPQFTNPATTPVKAKIITGGNMDLEFKLPPPPKK